MRVLGMVRSGMNERKSRRDSASKPRVVPPCGKLPWGMARAGASTPKGLRLDGVKTAMTQPLQGWPQAARFPRVARSSQPWAGGRNPFGVERLVIGLLCAVTANAAQVSRDYPVKPVPFTAVHLTDAFWAPRIETNRLVTIPFAFEQCEKSGRMDNFDRAAKARRGEELTNQRPPPYPFDDSDPYKVIEGASYALAVQPDARLSAYLDELIDKIGKAQEPDGYLYTARTINP